MYAKIKELCKKHGTSITELERELEFSRGSICKWDVNVPSIDKVKAVADYLDVTVDELLENDVKKSNNVASKLVELRGERAQNEIAKELNIAKSTYAMYEIGERRPSDKVKMKIADLYHLTVQEIFYTDDNLTGYSKFEELLKEKGVTAYRVAQETGVSTATLTSWKKGVYTPKPDKLQKLADYFGVPLSYFNDGFEFSLKNVPTEILLEELARRCKANE